MKLKLSDTLIKDTAMLKPKATIGRKTSIDLIDLEMNGIVSKVDTGAYKNALHCSQVEVIKVGTRQYLSFRVLDPDHAQYQDKLITVKDFSKARVINSFGEAQYRYVIKTRVRVTGQKEVFEAEFTLADRSQMKVPVLLGRKFLRHRFIVDVAA